MTTETPVTKRIKILEDKLSQLEERQQTHIRKLATLSRQVKRAQNLSHRWREETELNRDELNALSRAIFYLNRRSYANQGGVNYLLKKIENRDTESKP